MKILFQGDSITNAFRKPEEINPPYQLGNGYPMSPLARKNHSGEGKNGIASENSEKFVNGWADTALAGAFCDLGANSLIRAGFSAISGHGLSHWPQFSAIFARAI